MSTCVAQVPVNIREVTNCVDQVGIGGRGDVHLRRAVASKDVRANNNAATEALRTGTVSEPGYFFNNGIDATCNPCPYGNLHRIGIFMGAPCPISF